VEIPTARTRSAYLQVSDKHAFDWALVSCAAAANVVDGKLNQPRVALGSISPVPHQVEAANRFLEGRMLDDATASQAADMILAGAAAGTQRLQGADGACAHPAHAAQTERLTP
jgi:xanthine dehydrogenase YagS FAD-binding subunit